MKWNDYVVIQVFVLYEYMLAKWQKMENGKNNDKMENINQQNKTSIQIFQSFLTNEGPLALIFFRGLHIISKTYNLSIKGENYQLD